MEGGTAGGSRTEGDTGAGDTFSTRLKENITISGTSYFENTARVSPTPNGIGFGHGRIVIVTGQPRTTEVILTRPVYNDNGQVDTTTLTTQQNFPIGSNTRLGTDNQIIRRVDGALLIFKHTVINDQFRAGAAPPWANEQIQGYGVTQKRSRGCIEIYISFNYGESWQLYSRLDWGTFNFGKYGNPRPSDNAGNDLKTLNDPAQAKDSNGNLLWNAGGVDRSEVYACPFTKNIYFTGKTISGPYGNAAYLEKSILLYSTDGGLHWQVIRDDLPPIGALVMTSTPNGRLFLYRWLDEGARLYCSNLFKPPETPIIYDCGEVTQKVPGGNEFLKKHFGFGLEYLDQKKHPSISRISTDITSSKVRVSLNVLNEYDHQIIKILNLEVVNKQIDVEPPGGIPLLISVRVAATLQPQFHETDSMTLASFIDPDYVNFPRGFNSNTALLYWMEYPADVASSTTVFEPPPPDENFVKVRYAMFKDEKLVESPQWLSVKNGQLRAFDSRQTSGHYQTGGFFLSGNKLNYVAHWREPDGIKANIVTVKA